MYSLYVDVTDQDQLAWDGYGQFPVQSNLQQSLIDNVDCDQECYG